VSHRARETDHAAMSGAASADLTNIAPPPSASQRIRLLSYPTAVHRRPCCRVAYDDSSHARRCAADYTCLHLSHSSTSPLSSFRHTHRRTPLYPYSRPRSRCARVELIAPHEQLAVAVTTISAYHAAVSSRFPPSSSSILRFTRSFPILAVYELLVARPLSSSPPSELDSLSARILVPTNNSSTNLSCFLIIEYVAIHVCARVVRSHTRIKQRTLMGA
jgi:hypothetical protein